MAITKHVLLLEVEILIIKVTQKYLKTPLYRMLKSITVCGLPILSHFCILKDNGGSWKVVDEKMDSRCSMRSDWLQEGRFKWRLEKCFILLSLKTHLRSFLKMKYTDSESTYWIPCNTGVTLNLPGSFGVLVSIIHCSFLYSQPYKLQILLRWVGKVSQVRPPGYEASPTFLAFHISGCCCAQTKTLYYMIINQRWNFLVLSLLF